MSKLIVSYSRKDSVVARKLIDTFKKNEFDVWVDWEDIPPAVGWLEQILRGIEESDAFIFLISPDSVNSEVCKVEIEHAAKNNKRIIPIVLREVDPKTVIPTIRDLNWIFIREQDDFAAGIEKVKVAITLDIEWVEEHRRLQVRALEWHREKDPSHLLRGHDLRTARQMVASAESKDPKPTELQRTYIKYSINDETRRTTLFISAATALLVMIILSITAFYQSQKASANEKLAQEQKLLAQNNEQLAKKNAETAEKNAAIAVKNQEVAEQNQLIAEAQRSAARAQIYQSRTGGLYISTLLALDSMRRSPSQEAEDILRKNISLLPVPVAQMEQDDIINALEISSNDDAFVTASADGTVCVWNLPDGKMRFCATSPEAVEDAAFSPDGKLIATGDTSGVVMILDAQSGEIQNTYEYGVPIWDVNISPDGKSLAAARDDGRITFVSLVNRKFSFELITFGGLYVTAFSPDGTWIAAGSNEGTITFWNLGNGKVLNGPSHHGEVFEIAFSPDSNRLISGGSDSVAYMTLVSTGEELFKIINEDWVEDLTFSPDGKWFVTVSDDQRIRVWDTATGKEKLRMLQDSFLSSVEVSPDGQWLATTGYDKTVRVWNAATGAEMFQIPINANGNMLAFSRDGKYLISGDQAGEINVWDISALPASSSYLQMGALASNVQYSPSGEWMVASDGNEVWLLTKEQLAAQSGLLKGSPTFEIDSLIQDLIISPDSKWVAVTTDDAEVILYNVASKSKKLVTEFNDVPSIVFSADGSQLITGDYDGSVQAWDTASGALVADLFDTDQNVNFLAINAGQLAIGLQDQIVILDAATGEAISTIESPGDHQLLAFSADGSLLAANNTSGQVYIWQKQAGGFDLLQNIPSEQAASMIFNPKGDRLLIGALNNVFVLDPFTGGEITRIRHKDTVNSMSYSVDGVTLATSSFKAIQFWDMQKMSQLQGDDLIKAACNRLTQNFDTAQWTTFFGEEPYQVLCENLPVP
ncbi:MAG TPA: TIR domain-containing protein [Anaerolineales bacterium]|nr:TIR domain-containing protein [Anaerolineales bacterium]